MHCRDTCWLSACSKGQNNRLLVVRRGAIANHVTTDILLQRTVHTSTAATCYDGQCRSDDHLGRKHSPLPWHSTHLGEGSLTGGGCTRAQGCRWRRRGSALHTTLPSLCGQPITRPQNVSSVANTRRYLVSSSVAGSAMVVLCC